MNIGRSENKNEQHFSENRVRNDAYLTLLKLCRLRKMDVAAVARLGYKLMRWAKLHHHFFGRHSLYENALYLTFFVLGLPYQFTETKFLNMPVNEEAAIKIIRLFERRISERVPVEYLSQEAYYLGNKFYVNEHVLVPRSLMNSRFSDFLNHVSWENNRVLDLCAGSGCIGITLALLNPNIQVDLADISNEALKVAQINIDYYSLHDRVKCIQSNLFENIKEKYDLIITNPPYVSNKEYYACPAEIKNEPKIALIAGENGLEVIDKILVQAKNHLNKNGTLIAEVGYSVAKLLKRRYPMLPFKWFNYRVSSEKETIFEKIIRFSGYLDSMFLCDANGLVIPVLG